MKNGQYYAFIIALILALMGFAALYYAIPVLRENGKYIKSDLEADMFRVIGVITVIILFFMIW